MRRSSLWTMAMVAGLAACGGGGEGPESAAKDSIPGVDATGTADTEIFTDSPDTTGISSSTPPTMEGSGPVPDSQRAHAP